MSTTQQVKRDSVNLNYIKIIFIFILLTQFTHFIRFSFEPLCRAPSYLNTLNFHIIYEIHLFELCKLKPITY